MASIKDVAARAGVSAATASRALNDVPTVNPQLARKVRAAAKALDYRGNGIARSLRRRQSDIWALIISDIANPFFTAIARGVEDVAQGGGYSVVLCNTDEDAAKEERYLAVAERERVSGVLLSPNWGGSDISRLRHAGIPVIAIDRVTSEPLDAVIVDSSRGARAATLHLLDEGWRAPACITGPREADTAERRLAGYREALRSRRVRLESRLVKHTNYRASGAHEAVAALLDQPKPPDSFFVANSELALGTLEALAERGLAVGRDVGLVTFDDPPWARLVDPPLTVVSQPAYQIGVEAGELLLRRISEGRPSAETPRRTPRTVLLETELVIRGSSRRRAAVR